MVVTAVEDFKVAQVPYFPHYDPQEWAFTAIIHQHDGLFSHGGNPMAVNAYLEETGHRIVSTMEYRPAESIFTVGDSITIRRSGNLEFEVTHDALGLHRGFEVLSRGKFTVSHNKGATTLSTAEGDSSTPARMRSRYEDTYLFDESSLRMYDLLEEIVLGLEHYLSFLGAIEERLAGCGLGFSPRVTSRIQFDTDKFGQPIFGLTTPQLIFTI